MRGEATPGFELEVRVTVRAVQIDEDGITYPSFSNDQLEVVERTHIHSQSFLELASILGRFHDTVEELKVEQVSSPPGDSAT